MPHSPHPDFDQESDNETLRKALEAKDFILERDTHIKSGDKQKLAQHILRYTLSGGNAELYNEFTTDDDTGASIIDILVKHADDDAECIGILTTLSTEYAQWLINCHHRDTEQKEAP